MKNQWQYALMNQKTTLRQFFTGIKTTELINLRTLHIASNVSGKPTKENLMKLKGKLEVFCTQDQQALE